MTLCFSPDDNYILTAGRVGIVLFRDRLKKIRFECLVHTLGTRRKNKSIFIKSLRNDPLHETRLSVLVNYTDGFPAEIVSVDVAPDENIIALVLVVMSL